MGIESELIKTAEEQLVKKKLKKKSKSLALESDEIPSDSYKIKIEKDSPNNGKRKKKHTTIFPENVDGDNESLEKQRDSVSRLQPEPILISSEVPSETESVLKKSKKKKKSKDRLSLQIGNEPDTVEVSGEEAEREVIEDVIPEEEIHIEGSIALLYLLKTSLFCLVIWLNLDRF